MALKAAFIFLTDRVQGDDGPTWVKTKGVELLVVPVTSYGEAVQEAKRVVEQEGCAAIELCGGFGVQGTAAVARAVTVPVGVVRFDGHPGLGNVSGDTLYMN